MTPQIIFALIQISLLSTKVVLHSVIVKESKMDIIDLGLLRYFSVKMILPISKQNDRNEKLRKFANFILILFYINFFIFMFIRFVFPGIFQNMHRL